MHAGCCKIFGKRKNARATGVCIFTLSESRATSQVHGSRYPAVRVFSRDIGMEFGLDKCAVLVLKQGIKVRCEGIVLPDGQMMGKVDENEYKYLGVLEGADIMQKEMKEKVRQEYMKRVKLVAKSKLYGGNLIKAINAWTIGVLRYSAGILD